MARTTQGWHVVILSILILVIVFGMEFARRKKFPDDFFELLLLMPGTLFVSWLTLVVQRLVLLFKYATDLALDEWMQQVIQRAGVVQIGIAITNESLLAKIIRLFCKKKKDS